MLSSALGALGLTGVTRMGWWVVGIAFAMLLSVIGTLMWMNSGLRKQVSASGRDLGVAEAANVACNGTVTTLKAANEKLAELVKKQSAALDVVIDAAERAEAEAMRKKEAAEQRAAEHERAAAWLMAQQKKRAFHPGEAPCSAAVRVIREGLQ